MRHSRVCRTFALASFFTLSPALAGPLACVASPPTRAQFVARAEQICKAETGANRSVLAGVESMIRAGKLKRAAPRFQRAAGSLERARRRLAAIPRPPADRQRIARWLGFAKSGAARLRATGQALEQGRRNRVQSDANLLLREAKQANGVVVGFDFDYCRVNPARFS